MSKITQAFCADQKITVAVPFQERCNVVSRRVSKLCHFCNTHKISMIKICLKVENKLILLFENKEVFSV